ncbi:MAG TPA: NUDIX domain-containing protein [Acidimicrobiia bacterium]|nr:NUDIX domain-containing protein [Acidimicrobiia bacterium]
MDFDELETIPIARIKVRALVKCDDSYLFIQRQKYGKKKKFLTFPGGRIKKSDRDENDKNNLGSTLRNALERELIEELGAREIVIGEMMSSINKHEHDAEVLFRVEVGSYNWESRTGKEFTNPNKGTYELIVLKDLSEALLGKSALRLKPKKWRKLICALP